jgi:prepilin-type N-terminal cleavage/methylation domain-containing protein
MKNRKRGFSLVELLIVLAVIAALIATITPVALNAIKKSKATQVAQNLKTLASAIENKAYVDGTGAIGTATTNTAISNLTTYARDVSEEYTATYIYSAGTYTVTVTYTGKDVDATIVNEILKGATGTTGDNITYTFSFTVY